MLHSHHAFSSAGRWRQAKAMLRQSILLKHINGTAA
jgi:hypothetical protein